MTRVSMSTVPRPGHAPVSVLEAKGHAGNRDVCVAVTWTLRTLAEILGSIDSLEQVDQDDEHARFRIEFAHVPGIDHLIDPVVSLLERLAAEYPHHLRVEKERNVRHHGDCQPEGA